MRTIIFVGLLSIADAINPDWMSDELINFYAVVLFIAVFLDLYYFITHCRKL